MKKATTTPAAGEPTTTTAPLAEQPDASLAQPLNEEETETVYHMMEAAGLMEQLAMAEALCHGLKMTLHNPDFDRRKAWHMGLVCGHIEAQLADLQGAFAATFDFTPRQLATAA